MGRRQFILEPVDLGAVATALSELAGLSPSAQQMVDRARDYLHEAALIEERDYQLEMASGC